MAASLLIEIASIAVSVSLVVAGNALAQRIFLGAEERTRVLNDSLQREGSASGQILDFGTPTVV